MPGVDAVGEFSAWLSTNGVGTIGDDLSANAMPESTKVTVGVFEIPTGMPHLLHSTSYIRKPRFRIDVRSTAPAAGDYPDITNARNRAGLAYQACLDIAGSTLASTGSTGHWILAIPESEPYLSSRDEKNRSVFSFTVGCERQSG